jgi:hypothetical protein
MFEFHVGQDVTVLVGCGLGGTSLINANVVLEPGDPIFADHRWPAELRDHPEVLKPFLPIVMGAVLAPPRVPSWPRPRTSPGAAGACPAGPDRP